MLYISAPPDGLIGAHRRLSQLTRPELVAYPSPELLRANRRSIRHESDVPVMLSAMAAKPHRPLIRNTEAFTPAVAEQSGLSNATPVEFFETLSSLLR